jgi:NAD(P)-dependent dehydrogenase (short-subunit alcohol dehydrogenase family)
MMMTHGESPDRSRTNPDWKDFVLHARITIGGTDLMGADIPGAEPMRSAYLSLTRGSGLIINLSSIAGRFGVPFHAIYHASKWALEGYSMAMRAELASTGVDVVLVEPGPFTTELFPSLRTPADAEGRAASYPAVTHDTLAGMATMFKTLFEDPATPTDPSLVVDRLVELVEMAPGTRPLRSVVGVDVGVAARNAAVEPHDAGLLEAAGLTAFATLKT